LEEFSNIYIKDLKRKLYLCWLYSVLLYQSHDNLATKNSATILIDNNPLLRLTGTTQICLTPSNAAKVKPLDFETVVYFSGNALAGHLGWSFGQP
jgi:hypothetical protein